ncbi:Sporulation-control protein spo0M [Geobacillus stearothermophilus]|uniref:sporulation protein n=1 Tax=Geobacillus sp. DSP4a TaxID=2508873 RepID=UPI00067C33A6|nr:sporulation protein [Geobacillus sp. DSP4a]AKU26927.1 sporulation protein SpoOM [Geobacillus sp. LC300]KZE95618.1 Sporulation-control protein spo0M [Geobacillus stearothermophilus]NNV00100.1 sporulation protein [Geobacillus sp. DSP4a]
MWKKFLSKLGIGAAKVDLVLHRPHVRLGETLEGEFLLEGGSVAQHIRNLDVVLQLEVHAEGKAYRKTAAVIPVASSFTIQPGERKVLPFSYALPLHLPISRPTVRYTFVTRLDIADGADAYDQDAIHILPPTALEQVFSALAALGFREKATSGSITPHGQEFAFFPTSEFQGIVQEVEFFALVEEEGVRLYLEIDVRHGFGGEREMKRELLITHEQLRDSAAAARLLREAIEEAVQAAGAFGQLSGHPLATPHSPIYSHPVGHYPPVHHSHHGGHGWAGAIGGFAAGMLAGMVAEELLDDAVDDVADGLDVDDWFDGGDGFDGGDWL